MKLLFCTRCGDILSPYRENLKPRWCTCATHAVWWVDGARDDCQAYVLGINNAFLLYPGDIDATAVLNIHDACPDDYLFKQIGSPLIRVRPGQTRDTAWAAEVPTP